MEKFFSIIRPLHIKGRSKMVRGMELESSTLSKAVISRAILLMGNSEEGVK